MKYLKPLIVTLSLLSAFSIVNAKTAYVRYNAYLIPIKVPIDAPNEFYAIKDNEGNVYLSWSSVADAVSYKVQRYDIASGAWVEIYSGTDLLFDAVQQPAGDVTYRVLACEANGECGHSSVERELDLPIVTGTPSSGTRPTIGQGPDTDGDGITDADDQCVGTASNQGVDVFGCAEQQTSNEPYPYQNGGQCTP